MNLFQRWKQTSIANKALVISSGLMAFGTLFYAGAAIVQVCIMKAASKSSNEQMHQMIDAANTQAAAAREIAGAATEMKEQARIAVAQFQKAAAESAQASQTAARNAEKSLDVTIKTFISADRPWLSVEPATENQRKSVTEVPRSCIVNTKNIGRSPAVKVTDVAAHAIIIKGTDAANFLQKLVIEQPEFPSAVVPPGGYIFQPVFVDMSKASSDSIINGENFIVVYARVEYSDALGGRETYVTESCHIFNPKVLAFYTWIPCLWHNVMK
jgi:hypothetical protein